MSPLARHSGPWEAARTSRWTLLLAAVVGAAACGSEEGECATDVQCAPTQSCVHRGCVSRLGTAMAVWSVEVAPVPPSPHAARELPDFTFTSAVAILPIDRKVVVNATLARPPGEDTTAASSVNVTAAVASTIPGRRNLWFEAQSASLGRGAPYELALPLPERLVGQTARLTVTPAAPLNRTMCPWWLELPLTSGTAVTLPAESEAITVTGTVEPTGTGAVEFEARIFVNDQLASNLARTDVTGRFQLEVQRSWATRPGVTTRVEVGPADPMLPVPTLTTALPAMSGSIGSLRMPVHPPPVSIAVPVMDASGTRGVAGASVRFSAVLPGAVGGEARYVRTSQTGADGRATVLLVPSVAGQAVQYNVRVVPPADSGASSRCLAGYVVPAPDAEGNRVGPPIMLAERVILEGQVVRADGRAAAGMRVRATRSGDLFNQDCAGTLVSPPGEVTTDGGGRYRLRLDPGEYRIDYEPVGASALPRGVEERIAIQSSMSRVVALPPGVLVEAQVIAADGQPVPGAEVRAYGMGSDGRAEVRGLAVSDGAGRVRLILPHPEATR